MAKITGKVVKQLKDGTEILAGIPVILDNEHMIFANDKGVFNFWGVSPGVHVIKIREDMYAPYSKRVEVKDKDINLGTVYMRWSGL